MATQKQQPADLLIVEEDEDIALALRDRFEALGYRVGVAMSGPCALAMAASHRYHAVIVDLNLPDMDGLEVLEHLKEIDPTLLPIVLTSELAVSVKRQVIAIGAFAYLVKPYNGQELEALVTWAVAVKEMKGEGQQSCAV